MHKGEHWLVVKEIDSIAYESRKVPMLSNKKSLKDTFPMNEWRLMPLISPVYTRDTQNTQMPILPHAERSPGQRAILQGLWWVSGPSHGRPPYCGGVHALVLVLWPRPHVNEHKLHGDHSSQTPCTVIKQRSFNNKSREVKSKIFLLYN